MEPSQDSEAIEQEAARWLSSCVSDQWTDANQSQLDAWLDQSTAHRIAFIRLNATWKRCSRMIALRAGVPAGVIPKRGFWRSSRFFRVRSPETHPPPRGRGDPGKGFLLLATTLAFGIASAIGFESVARAADTAADVPAEAGRSDARKPTAQNSTTANRHRSTRRMAAIEELPLNISAQPLESALQQFAKQSGLQVLFPSDGAAMSRPAPAMTGLHTPPEALDQLLADTGLRYEYVNSRTVAIRAARSSKGSLTTHDGFITFDDTALADVVAEFNRYNRRKIFIEDPTLAAIRLGGNFRTDNTDAFLWLLQSGFPITVEQTEDKVVLK